MNDSKSVHKAQYISTVVLFMAGELIISAAAYIAFIPRDIRTALKIGMFFFSLIAWLVMNRSEPLKRYSPLTLGIFSVALGVLLAHYLGNIPFNLSGFSITSVEGVALSKLGEAFFIVHRVH